jgi:hypothetical protein
MKKYFNDPRPITVRYTGNCAECGTILKKTLLPIIGLLMAKFTAFPAANPSIGNSSQLQLMKPFTMESATRWPGKFQPSK